MSAQNIFARVPGSCWRGLAIILGIVTLVGCGGGGSSTPPPPPPPPPVNNTQVVQVNLGPNNNVPNGLYTSLQLCAPGSTTQCQTVTDIEVDTGSEGLRILSSALTVSLPAINDAGNNPLGECVTFADNSFVWGPLASADLQMAGEKASSVPIQIIGASGFPTVPSACNTSGTADDTVATLGANGIIGVGVFRQDCGPACSGSVSTVPKDYFSCPSSGCVVASVPLLTQLQNPVWLFPQDNNGVLISLPAIPDTGATTATGSMIFGIGTQSDNALGTAQVYTTDNSGNFTATYNGNSYSNSFIDSGSNGLFFLDATTLASAGIIECVGADAGFYCPASTVSFTATNRGANLTSAPVTFKIANADTLFLSPNSAFNDLGGDNPNSFDYGLPFFFGRNIFTGIEGQNSPGGQGPYWAY